mmetsp:Transcript_17974/g.30232  ORF Transcript_17974/g.30232 Transcript_17974/m.30232 type:complete len:242 (-) Transcript_17974:714-1439(-)
MFATLQTIYEPMCSALCTANTVLFTSPALGSAQSFSTKSPADALLCVHLMSGRAGLLRIEALEVPVQAGAGDGDERPDDRLCGDLVTEGNDGEADNEDALADVANGVCHRLDLAQGLVGDLVVQMVVHADVPQVPVELGSAHLGSGRGHARAQGAPLEDEDGGDAEEQRDHGHVVVHVDGVHVAHELLGEDGARGEEHVGRHGAAETEPREGQLGGGADHHSGHNGQEGHVHGEGVHLPVH